MLNNFLDLHCPDCGEKIEESDKYCRNCGIDLDAPLETNDPELEAIAKDHLGRAQKLYERGNNPGRALDECELALEHDPFSSNAHNLRGLILDDMGCIDEAIEAYKEALRIDPGHTEARENLRDAEKDQFDNGIQIQPNENFEFEDTLWPGIKKFIKFGCSVLLLFTAGGCLFNLGWQYLAPKTMVILEPDIAQVSTVTQDELQETINILTERSHALGYSKVTFSVSNNNEIIVKMPASINAEDFITKIDAIGFVEFVDFGLEPPAEGGLVTTDLDHEYLPEGQGRTWHTVMTNNEIALASKTQDQIGGYQVEFSLSEKGAQIFLEHTSQNVNTYLGIVLDKTVISTPIINSPIPGGQGVIQGNFSEEEVDELVSVLNSSPLPIPIRIKE